MCIWDAHTGELFETLPAHEDFATDLAFTPDSHGLICSCCCKMAGYWDVSPLVGEPDSHPDSLGVSKRDALNGSNTCTLKFIGSKVIEQVNLGFV